MFEFMYGRNLYEGFGMWKLTNKFETSRIIWIQWLTKKDESSKFEDSIVSLTDSTEWQLPIQF
jgi:hypothetical protein